jgi:hypothetical protein
MGNKSRGRGRTWGLLVLCIGALTAGSALAPPAGVCADVVDSQFARQDPPSLARLFRTALKKVHSKPQFAKAMVLEADGSPAGKASVKTASKITNWHFAFTTSSPAFPNVTIDYSLASGFGPPVGQPSPMLGDYEIRTPPRMTLAQAIIHLEAAGHKAGFFNVTLRNPVGPHVTPPFYIFGLSGNRFFAVNTKSGEVVKFS